MKNNISQLLLSVFILAILTILPFSYPTAKLLPSTNNGEINNGTDGTDNSGNNTNDNQNDYNGTLENPSSGNGTLLNGSFTVNYDPNGGNGTMDPSVHSTSVPQSLNTSKFTKTGYTQLGWSYSPNSSAPDFSLEQTVTGIGMNGETVRLYAVWSPNRYTVSFDSAGGDTLEPEEHTYDSEYGDLPAPTRKYYSFDGWYLDDKKITEYTKLTQTSAHTLVAHWTKVIHVITLDANSGSCVAQTLEISVTPGVITGLPSETECVKTGYTFNGWFTAPEGGDEVKNNYFICTEDTTVYAQWTANNYTVSFDSAGGDTFEPIDYTYDAEYGSLPTPTRKYYSFDGWYLGDKKITEASKLTETSAHTLVAHWTKSSYEVKLNANSGSCATSILEIPVSSGVITGLPSENACTRNGYAFAGWFTAPSGGEQVRNDSFTCTDDITIYAQWVDCHSAYSEKQTVPIYDTGDGEYSWYYQTTLSANLDIAKLKSLGYTKVRITVTFTVGYKEQGYRMVFITNSAGGLAKRAEFSDTDLKEGTKVVQSEWISIEHFLDGTYNVYYGARGNGNDTWYLINPTYEFTVSK